MGGRRINTESIILKLLCKPTEVWSFPTIEVKFFNQAAQRREIPPNKKLESHLYLAAIMAYLKISDERLDCDPKNEALVKAFRKAKTTIDESNQRETSWARKAFAGIAVTDASAAERWKSNPHPIESILYLYGWHTATWADGFDPAIISFYVNGREATDHQLRSFIKSQLNVSFPSRSVEHSSLKTSTQTVPYAPPEWDREKISHNKYQTDIVSEHGIMTSVRGRFDQPRLQAMINGHDWLVGAVNFYEDLHFSSFYTRNSCSSYLADNLKEFGYSTLVGIYENLNEVYYITRAECARVADLILKRALKDPIWLQDILVDLCERAEALKSVFPDDLQPFDSLPIERILDLYQSHNSAHMHLYEVARIPEAMDRGVGQFTAYLKEYLRKRAPGLASSVLELNHVFEVLTFPEEMSVLTQEIGELNDLLEGIQQQLGDTTLLSSGSQLAWIRMPPALRNKIEHHRKKWGCLGYHGLCSRTLPDVNYYLDRLGSASAKVGVSAWKTTDYKRMLRISEDKRTEEFKRHRIDGTHQMLYRLYSRVGVAKLYRKYVQLRNFLFLDRLLDELSKRVDVTEELLRCMLPEEIEAILKSGASVSELLQLRTKLLVHVIQADSETIVTVQVVRAVSGAEKVRQRDGGGSERRQRGNPIRGAVAACRSAPQ